MNPPGTALPGHRRHRPAWRLRLASLSRYWDIVRFKTYANLKRDIDKTYLGTIWWVLEPLISTAIYYVVFAFVFKSKAPNFVAFLLIGNTVYGHFSSSINGGANAILGAAGLIQQIQLPKSLYPIIAICNLTWKFLFSLIVIFPLLWLLHAPPNLHYVALPLLLGLQVFVVMAISLPLSILLPYFQDGRTLLTTLLWAGVWLSGVFFDAEKIPPAWRDLFYLNPAAALIESYRNVLMHDTWPEWSHFPASLLLCAASGLLGLWLIRKLGGKVAKLPL